MIAPDVFRRGKSEHHRARWFVTRTAGNRRKVPQKIHRRWPAARRAQVRLKWRGKSSPLLWRHKRQGKPHRVQDQIGKRLKAARLRLPGRSHEAPGDRRPESNDHACTDRNRIRLTARPNSLYTWPTIFSTQRKIHCHTRQNKSWATMCNSD